MHNKLKPQKFYLGAGILLLFCFSMLVATSHMMLDSMAKKDCKMTWSSARF